MSEIIAVFRAHELSVAIRIRIMKKLGAALDHQYGMNWTGDIVAELVEALEAEANE